MVNLSTIIIGAVLLAVVVLIIRSLIKKKGGCNCGCGGCCGCEKDDK